MTRRRRLAIISLLLAGLVIPMTSQPAEEIPFRQEQIDALGIELAHPARSDAAAGPAYPARVALPPAQERVISAGEGGVVEAVLAAEGQWVQEDEPLLRLQSAGIADLQREYVQALEREELAARQLARDEALFRDGVIPERRVQESRTAAAQARTLALGARRALEASGVGRQEIESLTRTREISSTQVLRSPFDGSVLEVMVHTGQRVDPTAPLLRLGQTGALWLEIRVPVESAVSVAVGEPIRLEDGSGRGEVIFVGQRVDSTDQSVVVRARVEQGADKLRPGQLVQARLLESRGDQALEVPSVAVVRRGEGEYVFVRSAAGFRIVPVTVLAAGDNTSVVSGELTPREEIAVRGVAALKGAWMGIGGE